MKKSILISLFINWPLIIGAPKLLDQTVATIYHPEAKVLLCQSDIGPGFSGGPRTLDDVILEELILLDAKKLKIDVTDEDVDRFLIQLQKNANLTPAQINMSFKELGYSPAEGKIQLKRMQIIQETVGFRVRMQKELVVTQEAIEEEYKKNPIKREASFLISQAELEFNPKKSFEENKKAIEDLINLNEIEHFLIFDDPLEVKDSEIKESQLFIKEMKPGQVSVLKYEPKKALFIKMVQIMPPTLIPLSERKNAIETRLKMQKYETITQNYNDSLKKGASIRYHIQPQSD